MSKKKNCPKCGKVIIIEAEHFLAGFVECASCGVKLRFGNKPTAKKTAARKKPVDPLASRGLTDDLPDPIAVNPLPVTTGSVQPLRKRTAADKPTKSKSKTPLYIALGVLGILLLGGLVTALWMFSRPVTDQSPLVANADDNRPTQPPTEKNDAPKAQSNGEFFEVSTPTDAYKPPTEEQKAATTSNSGTTSSAIQHLQSKRTFSDFTEKPNGPNWQPRHLFSNVSLPEGKQWEHAPDPIPSNRFEKLAGLEIEHQRGNYFEFSYNGQVAIERSDRNRRLRRELAQEAAAELRAPNKRPNDRKSKKRKKQSLSSVNVWDLTKLKRLGKFSGKMQDSGHIKPDGQYYVANHPVSSGVNQAKKKFYVWERDKLEEPVSEFEIEASDRFILWMGFISSDQYAIVRTVTTMATRESKATTDIFLDTYDLSKRTLSQPVLIESTAQPPKEASVCRSGSGKLLAIKAGSSITIMSTIDLRIMGHAEAGFGGKVRFSTDGKLLLFAGREFRAWNAETGEFAYLFPLYSEGVEVKARDEFLGCSHERLVIIGNHILDLEFRKKVGETPSSAIRWFGEMVPYTVGKQSNDMQKLTLTVDKTIVDLLEKTVSSLEDPPQSKAIAQAEPMPAQPPELWQPMELKKVSPDLPKTFPRSPTNMVCNGGFSVGVVGGGRASTKQFIRYDLDQGTTVGEPKTLGNIRAPSSPLTLHEELRDIRIAVSQDGKQVAVTTAESGFTAVQIFDEQNELIVDFKPHQSWATIDWLGFNSTGNLLTIADQKLTAWSLPAAKPLFQIDGSYREHAYLIPGTDLLVVSAGSYCDIVDVLTGNCVNRHHAHSDMTIVDMVVDPDLKRLTTVSVAESDLEKLRSVVPKIRDGRMVKSPASVNYRYSIVTRELSSGKAKWIECKDECDASLFGSGNGKTYFPVCAYIGDRHLAALGTSRAVFFRNQFDGPTVYSRKLSPRQVIGPGKQLFDRDSRDLVEFSYNGWPKELLFDRATVVSTFETPITVRVKGLGNKLTPDAATRIARKLEENGYRIGEGGLFLTVEAKVKSIQKALGADVSTDPAIDPKSSMTISMPRVNYFWTVTDQHSNELLSQKTAAEFLRTSSKYYVGSRRNLDEYEFKGDPFHDALEEIVEKELGFKIDFIPAQLVVNK